MGMPTLPPQPTALTLFEVADDAAQDCRCNTGYCHTHGTWHLDDDLEEMFAEDRATLHNEMRRVVRKRISTRDE